MTEGLPFRDGRKLFNLMFYGFPFRWEGWGGDGRRGVAGGRRAAGESAVPATTAPRARVCSSVEVLIKGAAASPQGLA